MKNFIHIIYILLGIVFILCFGQCKKEQNFSNTKLYNKTTAEIESYIQGKWRVHYQSGGICGICIYDRERFNEYYEFEKYKKIKYVYNNIQVLDTIYRWQEYQSNTADYIHKILEYYEGGFTPPSHFEVYEIKNDTLVLVQPFAGNPDYSLFFLTKVN